MPRETMTTQELHLMLDAVPDTREIVVRRLDEGDVQLAVWRAAEQDARQAYSEWKAWPGVGRHAAYLAASDQADAAAASLCCARAEALALACA